MSGLEATAVGVPAFLGLFLTALSVNATAGQSRPITSSLVTGRISYYSNAQPVTNATISAIESGTGVVLGIGQSDASGAYSLLVPSGSSFRITPTKQGDWDAGLSTLDAVSILQAISGAMALDPRQLLAADVTGNGTISTLDAVYILQMQAGLIGRFPVAQRCFSDWVFVPTGDPLNPNLIMPLISTTQCLMGGVDVSNIHSTVSGVNFSAVLFGDTTGNWLPSATASPTPAPPTSPLTFTPTPTPTATETPTLVATASPSAQLIGYVLDVGATKDVILDVAAKRAYVASVQFGLAVVDISDPTKPKTISSALPPFYAEHVSISGPWAMLTAGGLGVSFVDISDPTSPRTHAAIPGTFRVGCMLGRYGLLAETIFGNPAQVAVEVVDPATTEILGQINLGSVALGGIQAIGSTVYLAAGPSGLMVIDVSDPRHPRLINTLKPLGLAVGYVTINYPVAYLSTPTTLIVMDITNPGSPTVLGSLAASVGTTSYSNGRLYSIAGSQYSIFDVTAASSPRLLGAGGNWGAQGLAGDGSILYLATPSGDPASGAGGLYVLDTTLPSQPVVLSNIYNGYDDVSVAATNGLAVVAANALGARLLDVSSPTAPKVVATIPGTLRHAAMSENTAYFIETVPGNPATTRLDVFDISNPQQPTLVKTLAFDSAGAGEIKLQGNTLLFAAGSAGLKIIDVSRPRNAHVISTLAQAAASVSAFGSYAFLSTSNSIMAVDLSTPAKPVALGSVAGSGTIETNGQYVFAISGGNLLAFDFSNPNSPSYVSSSTNYGAQDLGLIGSILFLAKPASSHADPSGGAYVVDVSDPRNPRFLQQILVPGNTRSLAVSGNRVYFGDSAATLDIIQWQ